MKNLFPARKRRKRVRENPPKERVLYDPMDPDSIREAMDGLVTAYEDLVTARTDERDDARSDLEQCQKDLADCEADNET